MATARLVIKKKNIKKNGCTPVYLQYIFRDHQKTLINTGYEILPEHWHPEKQCIKSKAGNDYEKSYTSLNAELFDYMNDFRTFIANAIDRNITPTIKYVKDSFPQFRLNKNQLIKPASIRFNSIYDHIDDFIRLKRETVTKDTVKDYNSLAKHLRQFEKARGRAITFTSFDYNFYEDFVNFLLFETMKPNGQPGLKTNSAGKQIKNLKIFLRDRMRKEYCVPLDLSGYTTLTEEVDKIYLSWDEISLLYHFDISDYPDLAPTRDLLVLGCLLGLRYSDLIRISPIYIHNCQLRIKQKKTGSWVQIPIMNETKEILTKYGWHAPKVSKGDFNKNLKILGKVVGFNSKIEVIYRKKNKEISEIKRKYELMSSHICRRSFCTNEYLNGTDTHLIMKISGHRTEKAFLTYLKMDEVVAANKIAEEWRKRPRL